jgi:hypothetical protein
LDSTADYPEDQAESSKAHEDIMSAEEAARRQDLVKQISAFGFSEERATEALKRASSVDAAVGWLMDIDDEAADDSTPGGPGDSAVGGDDSEWLEANVDGGGGYEVGGTVRGLIRCLVVDVIQPGDGGVH